MGPWIIYGLFVIGFLPTIYFGRLLVQFIKLLGQV